jgi:DNA-binding IclR family transcriptional regulator
MSSSADVPNPGEDRYFITALSRGLDVLACFRPGDAALTNQQISIRCDLPKSTVTRVVYTLVKRGYLVQVDHGGYALGPGTLSLGSSMLARLDIRHYARPLMQELANFAGATLALGARDRLSIIYTEVVRSTATLALTLQVGSRVPIATSAIGRAYLVGASEGERKTIMRLAAQLGAEASDALLEGLARGLRDYEEYGCASSFGEWQPDVSGIAVKFRTVGSRQVQVINCGGPSSSLTRDFLLCEVRPRLLLLAKKLETSSTA